MSADDRVYLDSASSTPVHPAVARAVYMALEEFPGNPSAPHTEGRRAHDALERARRDIAGTLSVKPEELVFTSGGTESNNIAIQGLIEGMHARGILYENLHIVTTTIEHSSVLETIKILETRGVRVSYVSPDFDGIVRPEDITHALHPDTVLVTLAHVNSEVGTVQYVAEIGVELTRWKAREISAFRTLVPEISFPVLHVDAAQSPLYLDAGPHAFHADLVSYDAQKIAGPKGVGVLYRNFSVPLAALYGGGNQERGIRPGTENVPGIVGSAAAFLLAKEGRVKREERVRELRNYLIELVMKAVPDAELIGHPRRRIANNAFFSIPQVDGDYLAVLMDERGVAVSPRSACVGTGGAVSHVTLALTNDEKKAKGTIRFSLSPNTVQIDIERAVTALKDALTIVRLE